MFSSIVILLQDGNHLIYWTRILPRRRPKRDHEHGSVQHSVSESDGSEELIESEESGTSSDNSDWFLGLSIS
jgi:hypothetical protein